MTNKELERTISEVDIVSEAMKKVEDFYAKYGKRPYCIIISPEMYALLLVSRDNVFPVMKNDDKEYFMGLRVCHSIRIETVKDIEVY